MRLRSLTNLSRALRMLGDFRRSDLIAAAVLALIFAFVAYLVADPVFKALDARHQKKDQNSREAALKAIAMLGEDKTILGTGVFINPSGTLVTNSSILEERELGKVWAELPDGRRYGRPFLKCANMAHDIVVLQFNGQGLPAAPPSNSETGDNQRVFLAWSVLKDRAGAEEARTTLHHKRTSPSGIELIAFTAQYGQGILLAENGNLLGIAASPSVAPRSSGPEKYAVPASVFRQFFVKIDKPADLAPAAEAAQGQNRECGNLTDYSLNLVQEMSDEAAAMAAERDGKFDLAIPYYKDAVRQLRRIAFARNVTLPRPNLATGEQQAETSTTAVEAVAHWRDAINYLKMTAFSSISTPEPPQKK